MNYTVKQLAQLAGVSVRTLHHYDEIGLLPPPLVGANGYRLYDHASVLRLQNILFYRALEFPLETIKSLLDRPDFAPAQALRHQRELMQSRRGELRRLITAIDQTLQHLEGHSTMPDHELFTALTPEEEQRYTDEAAQRWDPAIVRDSQARWSRTSPARQKEILDEGNAIYRDLAAAMALGAESAPVQAAIERWRQHLAHFWTPDDEQCLGLARTYRDDPAFRANFDRVDPALAPFMVTAVEHHVTQRRRG